MPYRTLPNGVCVHSFRIQPFTHSNSALDYPPFFAYFEKLLSIPASFIDPRIVDVNNLNYDAWSVIAYQRTTVILSELVLAAALLRSVVHSTLCNLSLTDPFYRFVRRAVDPGMQRIISISLFLHPGFLIVDHIHFQYNGFMFGILLWSIIMAQDVRYQLHFGCYISSHISTQGNKLASGVLFAILLNFKHIYMYIAVSPCL